MAYIAKHQIRHNGKLYEKGDIVPLTYDEAQPLIKHKALEKLSEEGRKLREAAKADSEAETQARKDALAKAKAEADAAKKEAEDAKAELEALKAKHEADSADAEEAKPKGDKPKGGDK